MKKKFIIFTLCFTLIFSSLNYKKSYADVGVISLPMLATVSALAVGSGIVIKNNDDLYDIGRIFYDYIDKHNDLTWATVQSVFSSSVSLQANKLVSVKSEFLDIVKGFFDDIFNGETNLTYNGSLPTGNNFLNIYKTDSVFGELRFSVGGANSEYHFLYYGDKLLTSFTNLNYVKFEVVSSNHIIMRYKVFNSSSVGVYNIYESHSFPISPTFDFPYQGGYTFDDIESKKENGSISLPVPGDLDSLVGQNKDTFWGNTDNLVGAGGLTFPGVSNPSINVDSSVNTFPSVDTNIPGVDYPSVPGDNIWSSVKDFIVGLVVPSDTFWTDTWGGLYNNFIDSFPMVDMTGFNDLVTGEKKFPNIDISIMGVTGRVVNGDIINSIVDWLRPIIAGFMMICLMLFNYRKIYKLIRNTEPFGGIAPGTSDFRTGISEYKHDYVTPTGLSMPYEDFLEHSKTQRKWEMANPGKDYGKAGFTKVY